MYAVDPAWYTAHDAPGKQLTLLVDLLRLGRTLANVPVPALTPAPEVILRSLRAGSLSAIQQQIDPWTGVSQIGAVTVQIDNTRGVALTLPLSLYKSPVWVRLGVGVLASASLALPLFYGHVDQVTSTPDVWTLQLIPGAFAWHRDLSVPVGEAFPDAPESSRHQSVPILVGLNTDVEAIRLTAAVTGSLAVALDASGTELLLTEFQANFPATGTITIDTETAVTYTGRTLVVLNSVNYLHLTGLTRPSPVAHAVESAVTLVQTAWRWLVGTQSTVLAVRAQGVVLAAADYSVTDETHAGVQLTVLTLTDDVPQVTVDVTGGNLTPPIAPLVNGGFDTGDFTGWTLTALSGSVTSGATPDLSPFKAVFTAPLSPTEGQVTQTVSVEIGREVSLILSVQSRPTLLGNLVVNGDFATDDLTGWDQDLSAWNTVPVTGQSYWHVPGGVPLTLPISEHFTGAGITSYAVAPPPILPGIYYVFSRRYAQECAVTIGATYRVILTARVTRLTLGSNVYGQTRVQCRVLEQSAPARLTLAIPAPATPGVQTLTVSGTFTATQTAILLNVEHAQESRELLPLTVTTVQVALVPVDDFASPSTRVLLGTPTAPALYTDTAVDATLPDWGTLVLPVLPTADELLVTLAIQYDNAFATVAPEVWVDAVRLETTGRNPVEVIRWLITTFLPGLAINEPSFTAAALARTAWYCGGQWRAPGNSRDLLLHLADQFELLYFENAAGEAVLVPRSSSPPLSALVSPPVTRHTARGWRVAHPPTTHLGTDFVLYYHPRRGSSGQDPATYGAFVFATPDATSGPPTLAVLCASAAQSYGMRQTQRYFAEGIQDQETAHRKLTALVARQTTLAPEVTCTLPTLAAAPWEMGDTVALLHPLLGDVPLVGELVRVAVDLSQPAVTITARVLGVLGSEEAWEFPTFTLGDGTQEDWEV